MPIVVIIYLSRGVLMKDHKVLSVVSFVGFGLLGFIFLYNLIFALAAKIDPVIPMEAMVFALPMAVGFGLVPYGAKIQNRQLIYIGNMIGVVSALVFVYQTASLCLVNLGGALTVALLITMIWPLLVLATSLTMMAFLKKADFRPFHNLIILATFVGILLSFVITFISILVFAIVNKNGVAFWALLPTLFVFLSIVPVAFMAFALKDEARLVTLEVPEWVKPVKPAAQAPEKKTEEKTIEPKPETPPETKEEPSVDKKEETPKA